MIAVSENMKLKLFAVVAVLLGIGCGGSEARTESTLLTGTVEGRPTMEALPSPGVSQDALTERMRFAWLLAEESLELAPPPRPSAGDAASVQEWGDTVLREWLTRKQHTIDAARRELDVAAEEQHRQRIMAGAIVGLMYEDMARVLREIPLPTELESEPEIAQAYRDVIEFNAEPYLEHARRAYVACAANAAHRSQFRHWSRFCAERGDRLPAREDTTDGTTVTVSAD